MRKASRILLHSTILALFYAVVMLGLAEPVFAQTHARAKSKTSAKSVTKKSRRARSSRPSSVRGKARTVSQPKISNYEVRALLRKRGKQLTPAERQKLAAYRAALRRRRRAIIAARLRALRARDEALRNSAAINVLNDNTIGEDAEIRRASIEALGGRAGTVVVMDPNNGRIFSAVNQRMAVGSPVKPCSTIKLVVGLAALHEGVFDPNLDVPISARYSLNLTDALARSDNPFFQILGRRLSFERVLQYALNYGFGAPTGVNYPGESPGFLPMEGEEETGHMSSHGDGFGVTAMQLAAFTAAIANGGNLYVPRVPRTPEDAADFKPVLRRKIEMSAEDRLRTLSGMSGTVNFGTGKLAYDPLGQVAGKTGTCTGATDKLGLFTSFSSLDNPRLVVSVITTGSTEAGKRAADIAGRVYRAISYRFLRQPTLPASTITEIPRSSDGNQK